MLIKEINVWSVARTVFPLAWIVSAVVIFLGTLFVGRVAENLISRFADMPLDIYGGGVSVLAGIALGLVLGFLNSIITTLVAVLAAFVYNFLASLGGGISVRLAGELSESGSPDETSGRGDEEEADQPA
ncbi:MAG: DUF3566 domain-containing protein [Fidelibacterota bacterium]|nr:MAG: DUF3566 domain-containing protein [Candidatus Neomarinimicrobiota bacterium]